MTNATRSRALREAETEPQYGPQPGFSLDRRSMRAGMRAAQHTRRGPMHANRGIIMGFKTPFDEPLAPAVEALLSHTTMRRPWVVKAERRAANKVARLSRRANRP